jgi:hypothetical protein
MTLACESGERFAKLVCAGTRVIQPTPSPAQVDPSVFLNSCCSEGARQDGQAHMATSTILCSSLPLAPPAASTAMPRITPTR